MFGKIASFLAQQPEVAEWQISRDRETSSQLYVTDYQPESERKVEQELFQVLILTRKDDPEFVGETSLLIQPGDELEEKLTAALKRASYVRNKAYTLPEKQGEDLPIQKPKQESQKETVRKIARDYEAIKSIAGIKLSYFEIFVTDRETRIENSKGLKTQEGKRSIFTEFVLLSEDGRHEAYNSKRSGNYANLNILREIQLSADGVRNLEHAQLPPSRRFNVLFTEETLDTLFNYFVKQANASALYAGWSVFMEGEDVIENPTGDRLTIDSDPTLEGMTGSGNYDQNGLKRSTFRLIEANSFRNRIATQKYACYTGVKATGSVGNIVVGAGTMSLEELSRQGEVLEVLQFSTFEPNEVTGAFSGEIRFGKLRNRDGSVTWIKGGSVSGKMSEAFKNARFSKETTQRASYLGPAGVLLHNLSVAGTD